jgi:RNA polymerase sigma factor (sigma-70 family)
VPNRLPDRMTPEEFKSRLMPVKDKIYRFALSLLVHREEAEDATQEVYLKMWEMKKELGKYRNMEALMMTITRNHCLDRLKLKKNKAESLDASLHDSHVQTPQKLMEQSELMQRVEKIMQLLPEQQRTLVHLRDVEGYEYDEMQEITGFDPNYIRVNLSRGRKKIREMIQNIQQHETRNA